MDLASTIMSIAITAAIAIPVVIGVVFAKQLIDIARGARRRRRAEQEYAERESTDPDEEP